MAGWVLESTDPALIFRVTPDTVKTIGRASGADFVVDAGLLSRLHCKLTADRSNQLVVEDLDSTNGTLVNGARVERAVVRAGDVLTVGRLQFTCRPA